jgi:hypothetical protein
VLVTAATSLRIGEKPLVFSGTPPLLNGDVELINDSDQKIAPKGLDTEFGPEHGIHADLRIPGRLAARSRTRVRAQFIVDRDTRPGTYEGTVRAGSQTAPATVHVYERKAAGIAPTVLQFAGAPGDHVELHASLTNNGNAPQALPKNGVVFFEETNWVGRSLVFALRDASAGEGMQRYLDRVLHELVHTMASTTTVTINAPQRTIEPGSTFQLRLAFTLPDRLTKGRTYSAWLPLAGTRVTFELQCNGAANSTLRRPT